MSSLSSLESRSSSKLGLSGLDEHSTVTVWTTGAKTYLVLIVCFCAASLGLTLEVEVLQVSLNEYYGSFQITVILSQVFLLLSAVFAIRSQNMISIIFTTIFNIYIVISGVIEAAERTVDNNQVMASHRPHHVKNKPQMRKIIILLWLIPAVDACFQLGVDYAAWKMYRELGWIVYEKVSASVTSRSLYRRYLILNSLFVFSCFFSILNALIIPSTRYTGGDTWREFVDSDGGYVVIGMAIMSVLYIGNLAVSSWAIRRENKLVMGSGIVGQLANVGASAWYIYFLFHGLALAGTWGTYSLSTLLLPSKIIFQLVIANLLFLSTLAFSVRAYVAFGSGLKEILATKPERDRQVDLTLD